MRRVLVVLLTLLAAAVVGAVPATARPDRPATPGGLTPSGRTLVPSAFTTGDCELAGVQCRPDSPPQASCTGYTSQTTPPATIRVLVRTGQTTTSIQTVDFRTYVQNVLPNEWFASWDGDALKAGAVAVKSYAWYWVTHYGGYVGSTPTTSSCFDVTDDPDFQVYRAGSAVTRTSNVVNETWPVAARRGGRIVQTFYRAYLQSPSESCGAGRNGTTMSQYGTQACNEASTGYKYNVILRIYYGSDLQLTSTAQLRTQHDFTYESTSTPGTFSAGRWSIDDGYPTTFSLGSAGDQPMVTTDGDGFALIGLYRPSTSTFYVAGATGSLTRTVKFGAPGDIPVQAQYGGLTAVTQLGVFRPSTGTWYLAAPSGSAIASTVPFGRKGDIPVPGRWLSTTADSIAVFRPSTGVWYVRGGPSTTWGVAGDVPLPADYTGDGRTDIAVYRPSTCTFYIRGVVTVRFGRPGDIPVTGDFTGDGRADIAVYRPSTHEWFVRGGPTFTFGSGTPIGAAPYHD